MTNCVFKHSFLTLENNVMMASPEGAQEELLLAVDRDRCVTLNIRRLQGASRGGSSMDKSL
jgi:hypothetical protein